MPSVLATSPYPFERSEGVELYGVLCELYPTGTGAGFVAQKAGIAPGDFNANQAAGFVWKELLEFGAKAGLVRRFVEVILEELPLTSPRRGYLEGLLGTPDSAAVHPPPLIGQCHGREYELGILRRVLIDGNPGGHGGRVCCVEGMAGVGKSMVVEEFANRHWRDHFPGGYLSLKLDPLEANPKRAQLLERLADLLQYQSSATVRARLTVPRTLLHVENVDSEALAVACDELLNELAGVPVVFSSRVRKLSAGRGWRPVVVEPLEEPAALAILAEYDVAADEDSKALCRRLGYLPMAIRLVGGALQFGEYTAAGLLDKRSSLLDISSKQTADIRRKALRPCFDISLRVLLVSEAAAEGALRAFGHLPLAGVGASLGSAWCELDEPVFRRVFALASRLSLTIYEKEGRWRAHPLMADYLRELGAANGDAARFERVRAWFEARFPATGDEKQGRAWGEIGAETAALEAWLTEVPAELVRGVERAATEFGVARGPFRLWMKFCQRGLAWVDGQADTGANAEMKSDLLWTLSNVAESAGELGVAMEAARNKEAHDGARGAVRERALALGRIADVFQARGDIDEALRIRREEELPVYVQLKDARAQAVCIGRIADGLQLRGDVDEALRIRRDEELPVYHELRDKAVTWCKIADVLHERGELDEAVRIRQEQLPVLERLGDAGTMAITKGTIADVLMERGEMEEAARIYDEQLAVFAVAEDVREAAAVKGKKAALLEARGDSAGALRIYRDEQLPVFAHLGDVRAIAIAKGKIAGVLQALGDLDEALRIREREQLPVFEKLKDARAIALTAADIADIAFARGVVDEAIEAYDRQTMPVLERMGAEVHLAKRRWKLAQMLRQRGTPPDIERASALTARATEAARRMRLAPLLAEIEISRGKAAASGMG